MKFDHEALITKKGRQRPRTLPFLFSSRQSCSAGLLAEGVADRGAYAKDIRGVESLIVLDVIVVSLRAHEDVRYAVPNVVAEAGAEVFHEMIAAGEVDASRAAAGIDDIEPVAGNADAGHDVEAPFRVDLRLEEDVRFGEERTVIFVTVIAPLLVPPGSFDINTEAMREGNDIPGQTDVESSRFCQRLEGDYVGGGRE